MLRDWIKAQLTGWRAEVNKYKTLEQQKL